MATPDWTTIAARLRAAADMADRGDARVIDVVQYVINDMRALVRIAGAWTKPHRAAR